MAQVFGPLHSESASGQFAKTLIYQGYHGKNYVKAYGKPNWDVHPPTAPQLAVQALTKQLMQHWEDIQETDRATWDTLAVAARVSRVNSYLKENYARHRAGRQPIDWYPETEPYRIYSGGTLTADLDDWTPVFNDAGEITARNASVFSTHDIQVLEINSSVLLDGLFDLRAFWELEEINVCGTALTLLPLVNWSTYLYVISLIGQAFIEVDSLFNDIAATHSKDAGGAIDVSGGTSAAPTAASAAARAWLTDPSGNWTITTN